MSTLRTRAIVPRLARLAHTLPVLWLAKEPLAYAMSVPPLGLTNPRPSLKGGDASQ